VLDEAQQLTVPVEVHQAGTVVDGDDVVTVVSIVPVSDEAQALVVEATTQEAEDVGTPIICPAEDTPPRETEGGADPSPSQEPSEEQCKSNIIFV
jgi:hypothetical protein